MYKEGPRGWQSGVHFKGLKVAIYLGIDVSKAKLDCSLLLDKDSLRSRSKTLPNSKAGFAALLEWVQRQTQVDAAQWVVAMEPTGVYHQALALALYEAKATVVVVNPAQLREFAKGLAVRTKTDAKDSMVLARYAAQPQRTPWQPPPLEVRQLQALMSRIEAVQAELQRELNRQDSAQLAGDPQAVQASIADSIAFWRAEQDKLQRAIDEHIDRHPGLKQEREYLLSIPAVGEKTANRMLCMLHSRPFACASQAAAFVGLTPIEHQSGSSVRGRPRLSKAGNPRLRAALYMAAVVAKRHNPDVRALYDRLLKRGKTKMSALCAAMRKLVHICFGVLKNRQNYVPQAKNA
jgi:transposase